MAYHVSHICNLKVLTVTFEKEKEKGDINFDNIFYLTYTSQIFQHVINIILMR